jgi:probable F420-dependent oxidoreductase
MTAPRPVKPFAFGVQLYAAADAAAWREQARRAADLGYRSVHLPDHLGGQFSPLLALAAAAAAAPGLRIGTLVLNCAIRHPVVLAKELATLDVLTEGRLQVGVGAGWQLTDFARAGIDRLRPAARIRRLIEYVTILDDLWRGKELTHHGEFYRFADARCLPRPVQPEVPLLVGGGSVTVLSFAGRQAQGVGLDVPQPAGRFEPRAFLLAAGRQAFRQRAEWARAAAAAAGNDITLYQQIPSDLVHLDGSAAAEVAARWDAGTDELLDSPLALVGEVDVVVERLRRWREESGVSYLIIPADAMDSASPLVARLAGT